MTVQRTLWLDTTCFFDTTTVHAGIYETATLEGSPAGREVTLKQGTWLWQWTHTLPPEDTLEKAPLAKPLVREGTTALLLAIQSLQTTHPSLWQTLTHVLIHQGPGGFTGIRQGMLIARAVAQWCPSLSVAVISGLQLGYVHTLSHHDTAGNTLPTVSVNLPMMKQGGWISQVFPLQGLHDGDIATSLHTPRHRSHAEARHDPLPQWFVTSEELWEAFQAQYFGEEASSKSALMPPYTTEHLWQVVARVCQSSELQSALGILWQKGYQGLTPFYATPPSITPPRTRPRRVFT
jgi:hypothetical protein